MWGLSKFQFTAVASFLSCIVLPFFFWVFFLNHISINEVGVAYNSWNGEVTIQDKPGWYVTSPLTFVGSMSTLPIKVKIPSPAAVINEKVVRFKHEGIQEYIRLQGWHWSNMDLEAILMGYAFSGEEYPFLEIIQEAGPESLRLRKNEKWQNFSEKK